MLVGSAKEKRPLYKPRRIWEDNTERDRREIWCEEMDWILWFRMGLQGSERNTMSLNVNGTQ